MHNENLLSATADKKTTTSGSYPVCVRDVHDDGTRVATRHLVVLFDEAIGVGT